MACKPWATLPFLLLLAASGSPGVAVRSSIGDLHGFPSLSDTAGRVIADGELRQERRGDRVVVHVRWVFGDGREVDEHDEFEVARQLAQVRFAWSERSRGEERRRFEVDFETGRALAVTRERGEAKREEVHLDLPRGRAFAGYGTALAVAELPLERGAANAELTFVAFTPKPRTVDLEVRRDGQEAVSAGGRAIPCDRLTLHAKIPFPIGLFVHPDDAHLWFTHTAPRALVRAEQNLAAKDDPLVVVDVIPRGAIASQGPSARAPAGSGGR
jgi:hypothetical protein